MGAMVQDAALVEKQNLIRPYRKRLDVLAEDQALPALGGLLHRLHRGFIGIDGQMLQGVDENEGVIGLGQ